MDSLSSYNKWKFTYAHFSKLSALSISGGAEVAVNLAGEGSTYISANFFTKISEIHEEFGELKHF